MVEKHKAYLLKGSHQNATASLHLKLGSDGFITDLWVDSKLISRLVFRTQEQAEEHFQTLEKSFTNWEVVSCKGNQHE